MPDVTIRPLGIDERADWEPLWEGYQAFYKVVIPAETTAVTWARLHDATEPMHALGAYVEGRLHGIVHYTDGVEGTRERLAVARKYAPQFAIATECGFGRRDPGTIPELLRIHAAVAELE